MAGFGFIPNDPDDSNDPENNRPDFEAMMRQMQEQMKAQFEQLGINPVGFVNPFTTLFSQANTGNEKGKEEVLSISTARETAKKFVTAQGLKPIGAKELAVVNSAFEISEIWLDEALSFPATNTAPISATRLDWVDQTMSGWHKTIEPLAAGLSAAISNLLDQAMNSQNGEPTEGHPPIEMITMMLRSFISTMIATQLGQSIGTLATSVTGAHDVGLSLLDQAHPVVIPENIENWANELEIPKSEVFIYHALREGAVARLFANNPWLISYIQSAIVEYGKGINIDIDAIQRQAQSAFENMEVNPQENMSFALDSGIFTPEESPAQKIALAKLETVLALIDGWTDEVTALAAGERLPAIEQLRETLRRRRASSAPAQQLFSSMLGLQVSPKLTREASAFWKKIREVKSIAERDQIWSGLLPTAEDLLDPEKFLASTSIPDDLSGLL